MSDMKCPFCQQELRKIHPTYVICDNCRITGDKELWQELIRTRKALDVAIEELTKIKTDAESVGVGFFMTAAIFALAKIKTALEQKDK